MVIHAFHLFAFYWDSTAVLIFYALDDLWNIQLLSDIQLLRHLKAFQSFVQRQIEFLNLYIRIWHYLVHIL
jgi:hypothetical protein